MQKHGTDHEGESGYDFGTLKMISDFESRIRQLIQLNKSFNFMPLNKVLKFNNLNLDNINV